jgi:hypothetical protein
MTELKFFRLTLVFARNPHVVYWQRLGLLPPQAEPGGEGDRCVVGEYNRYIQACGDGNDAGAWDLAGRAHESMRRSSEVRDLCPSGKPA